MEGVVVGEEAAAAAALDFAHGFVDGISGQVRVDAGEGGAQVRQ